MLNGNNRSSPLLASVANSASNSSNNNNVLSIEQMQQAMMHLIQNDHSFLKKLYDAYLASVREPTCTQVNYET